MDTLVAEIAQASKEQSQGIEQVNSAMSQMDNVTQTSAASAEESASASKERSAQAVSLKESVVELQRLVGGTNHAGSRREVPVAIQEDKPLEKPVTHSRNGHHAKGTNGHGPQFVPTGRILTEAGAKKL